MEGYGESENLLSPDRRQEQGVFDEALITDIKAYVAEHREKPEGTALLAKVPHVFSSATALMVSKKAFMAESEFRDVCETGDLDEISTFVNKTRNKVTFSVFLDKLRREKGLSPSELYNQAGIDRRHWQKITETREYRPTKETVIKFGLALELSVKNMDALLETAGFVLSASSTFDLVIRYCLEHEIYNHIVVDQCLDVICERVLYSA
jgi:hypothetical protein